MLRNTFGFSIRRVYIKKRRPIHESVKVMSLLSVYGASQKRGDYSVVDSASDGGISASLIGGDMETFMAVVTDKTSADIQTSPTENIGNQPLPLRIPPAGGSHRIKVTLPSDKLLNPESLEIRFGWKREKKCIRRRGGGGGGRKKVTNPMMGVVGVRGPTFEKNPQEK